ERTYRVRQRADGDCVHAGLGDGSDGGQGYASRRLETGAAMAAPHRLADRVRGHVVQQDGVGSAAESLVELVERVHLDLDRLRRLMCANGRDRLGDAAG